MRQNRNITVAYDLSEQKDKEVLNYIITIATNTNRSISQVAKTLLELGLIIFDKILEKNINEAK